jgi:hypothetical protein
VLRTQLVGSIHSDPPIHGVTRGGAPWVGTGTATLDRHGRFKVRIRGLVIPTLGNPGPVTSLKFSLFCAPDSSDPVFHDRLDAALLARQRAAAAARHGSAAVPGSGRARAPEREPGGLHRGFGVLSGKTDEPVHHEDELVLFQAADRVGVES